MARPGGLGSAPDADVREIPSIDLRAAMALAADRDSIARQYRDGYGELFALGLPALGPGFAGLPGAWEGADASLPVPAALTAAVQRVYLAFLAARPDSHIVRKHGATLAHTVMRSAQAWQARAAAGAELDSEPDFAAWDLELKAAGLNPGTSADLTVAALFVAGVLGARGVPR
jgi:triphosphoribosyl-dephospho-CoA synthase